VAQAQVSEAEEESLFCAIETFALLNLTLRVTGTVAALAFSIPSYRRFDLLAKAS